MWSYCLVGCGHCRAGTEPGQQHLLYLQRGFFYWLICKVKKKVEKMFGYDGAIKIQLMIFFLIYWREVWVSLCMCHCFQSDLKWTNASMVFCILCPKKMLLKTLWLSQCFLNGIKKADLLKELNFKRLFIFVEIHSIWWQTVIRLLGLFRKCD